MSVIHTLSDMEKAVNSVRAKKTDKERYEVIAGLLRGQIDYAHSYGKMIGSRRATFCTLLSRERLWPGT